MLSERMILRSLLEANMAFDLQGKGTTLHLPMALVALADLGADDQRLIDYFGYWARRKALPGPVRVPVLRTLAQLDQVPEEQQFHALQAWVLTHLRSDGVAATLTEFLAGDAFTPGALAFHGLIRLACGLHAGHDGEIAAGIAALRVGRMPMPLAHTGAPQPPEASWAALAAHLGGRTWAGGPSITGKMRTVAANADFAALLAPLPEGTGLADLADLAIRTWWLSDNFTALHLVTGLHATRIVLAHAPAQLHGAWLQQTWPALAAAYVSFGAPALPPREQALAELPQARMSRSEVEARARVHQDDHVIKSVWSSYAEQDCYDSPFYHAAAQRKVLARGED